MKRILVVASVAALLCLGITGLRVTLLQQMTQPERPAPVPQHIDQPEPPPAARPSEFVAALHGQLAAHGADTVLAWSHGRSAGGE